MKRSVVVSWRVLVFAAFCLLSGAFVPAASADQKPLYARITVTRLTVEAQPFEGAPNRLDQADLIGKLEEEATKQARRTLTEHGFVETVEPVGKVAEAQSPLVLTGTVRLPVSLPANVYGFDAYERRGQFATATVTVKRRDGTVLATAESRLTWKACWWETGRNHRNIPVDDVLADFVRKATDRATRKAFQQASAKAAHGQG